MSDTRLREAATIRPVDHGWSRSLSSGGVPAASIARTDSNWPCEAASGICEAPAAAAKARIARPRRGSITSEPGRRKLHQALLADTHLDNATLPLPLHQLLVGRIFGWCAQLLLRCVAAAVAATRATTVPAATKGASDVSQVALAAPVEARVWRVAITRCAHGKSSDTACTVATQANVASLAPLEALICDR